VLDKRVKQVKVFYQVNWNLQSVQNQNRESTGSGMFCRPMGSGHFGLFWGSIYGSTKKESIHYIIPYIQKSHPNI
jgi:hypothetical protein